METVMILGAGPLQVPALQKAKALGLRVIACDYDPHAVGLPLADIPLLVSTIDKEAVLEQARRYRPDYVITSTSDMPVRTAAYVCEQLGLPTDISYADAVCATDKGAMRRRLAAHGVPIPRFYACDSYEAFRAAVAQFSDVCVVKPADNAASRGVELLDAGADEDAMRRQYAYSKGYSRGGTVMVEEYMTGPEVSVESLIVDGKVDILAITDKIVTPLPFFVELGHTEQSRLPEAVKAQIRTVTEQAIHAIGIRQGCSHAELKITPEGPKIVEIAARLGGDQITSRLVPLATGVDMVDNSILLALHRPVDNTRRWDRGSAIRFFQTEREGTLRQIRQAADVAGMPGVEEVAFYVKPGDTVGPLRSSNDRLGHVITSGATAQQAADYADAALRQVAFLVE